MAHARDQATLIDTMFSNGFAIAQLQQQPQQPEAPEGTQNTSTTKKELALRLGCMYVRPIMFVDAFMHPPLLYMHMHI